MIKNSAKDDLKQPVYRFLTGKQETNCWNDEIIDQRILGKRVNERSMQPVFKMRDIGCACPVHYRLAPWTFAAGSIDAIPSGTGNFYGTIVAEYHLAIGALPQTWNYRVIMAIPQGSHRKGPNHLTCFLIRILCCCKGWWRSINCSRLSCFLRFFEKWRVCMRRQQHRIRTGRLPHGWDPGRDLSWYHPIRWWQFPIFGDLSDG